MYTITNLKPGVTIQLEDGKPYEIVKSEHTQMGRGGGIMRTTLKNLETGATLNRTFKGEEKIKEADLEEIEAQFMYADKNSFNFMDLETFEQFPLKSSIIGDAHYFIKKGQNVKLLKFNDRPITLKIPAKVTLKVTETEPGIRGDTVSSATKPAKLETGLTVQVPLFIKQDDEVVINTREMTYVERA